jgi:GNAT superfamily N-acetyltransferase
MSASQPQLNSVNMIRPHMDGLPAPLFPAGYSIRPMSLDDIGLWIDIEMDAEPFFAVQPDLFRKAFGDDLAAVPGRCFILTDPRGLGVGTISAWYNREFNGQDYGRIHWVAVRPSHQGKGLARAGLAYAMRVLAQWHDRAYLVTAIERIGAIKLYLDFDFAPDLAPEGARAIWSAYARIYPHPLVEKTLAG